MAANICDFSADFWKLRCLVQKTFGNTAESNARRLLARIASGLHDEAKARQAIADLEALLPYSLREDTQYGTVGSSTF